MSYRRAGPRPAASRSWCGGHDRDRAGAHARAWPRRARTSCPARGAPRRSRRRRPRSRRAGRRSLRATSATSPTAPSPGGAAGGRARRLLGRSTSWSTAPAAPSARRRLEVSERGVERDHRHQPHRHAARVPGVRPAHAGAGLRAASSTSRRWRRSSALYEVAAYTASKAGVAALTKSLAMEWGPRGVNVNAIAPGVFRTALNRKLHRGQPARAASCWRARRCGASARSRSWRGGGLPRLRGRQLRQRRACCAVDGGFLASGVNQ